MRGWRFTAHVGAGETPKKATAALIWMLLIALVVGALARHMETGCARSAYLAALLLERETADPKTDDHQCHHARERVDILDREGDAEPPGLADRSATAGRDVDSQRLSSG